MRIEVLLFASLQEELGPRFAVEVEAPAGGPVTVGALRAALRAAHPAFERLGRQALVAVNLAVVSDAEEVRPHDEVAVLPPLAGG